MFLVDRLASNPESLGDPRPTPTGPHRLLDGGVFQLVGQAP